MPSDLPTSDDDPSCPGYSRDTCMSETHSITILVCRGSVVECGRCKTHFWVYGYKGYVLQGRRH